MVIMVIMIKRRMCELPPRALLLRYPCPHPCLLPPLLSPHLITCWRYSTNPIASQVLLQLLPRTPLVRRSEAQVRIDVILLEIESTTTCTPLPPLLQAPAQVLLLLPLCIAISCSTRRLLFPSVCAVWSPGALIHRTTRTKESS